MSDTYQAVYDAVRSKISGGDINSAVEEAIRNCGLGDQVHAVALAYQEVAAEQCTPSVLYRPTLSVDGDKWCALYGDNLQDGVAGFGDSPVRAMMNFDQNWLAKLIVSPEQCAQRLRTQADELERPAPPEGAE